MENSIKIIISGLDGAGKTSILTALDRKYDFQKDIMELTPTIKVNYHKTTFISNSVNFWDMGGQTQYREMYLKREEMYFGGTDLIVYIIDCQDKSRFEESLSYLDDVLRYFIENNIDIPLIISFHKFDPEIRADEDIIENIDFLREEIITKYPSIKALFQQTSIYDIISIVQLISYGLSVFDEKFFDLSELLETYLEEFNASALILFDKNGIIISEFYNDRISSNLYIGLLESIKEHLFILKRMQEEEVELEFNFFTVEGKLLSYLHRIKGSEDISFFISVLIEEKEKEALIERFADFMSDLENILKELV